MTRTLARVSLAAALALGAGACASTSDVQHLQNQVADLQDQVAQLKRTASSKEEVQNVNTRIGEQTTALLKSNATLVAKVDQIEDKINNSQGSQEQSGNRIDHLAQQLTQVQHDIEELRAGSGRVTATGAPGTVTVPPPPPPGGISEVNVSADGGESPMATYQNAYRDYQQGRYDLAIAGFREFVEKNPSSELAGNAAYWIGESLYSQKKYRESVVQFDRVVTGFPKSDKVPSALLKKGYAYISLGDNAQGIVQLQYVVHEHPKSPEAGKAREELKKLGVEKR